MTTAEAVRKPFRPKNPGELIWDSIRRLNQHLAERDPKANELLRGLLADVAHEEDERKIKVIAEMLAAVRHAIYTRGSAGGHEIIEARAHRVAMREQRAEGLTDPKSQEDGNIFARRMRRIRTGIALRVVSALSSNAQNKMLGPIKARFAKLKPEAALNFINGETEELKKHISASTPIDELLNIIAFSEDPQNAKLENAQRLSHAAKEFLIRRLITSSPDMIRVFQKFFEVRHFQEILKQMPETLSNGRIGGKASGIALAHAALEQPTPNFDEQFEKDHRLKEGELKETFKDEITFEENSSNFIGSRIFEAVLNANGELADAAILKGFYEDGDKAPPQLHARLTSRIEVAKFPEEIDRQLWILFEKLHGKSIIIRSSSELEDRKGAAFSGKYKSVTLTNCSEDKEADYEKFKKAILSVYASVFSPDVLAYRYKKGLLSEDEEMGVIIQELNVSEHGKGDKKYRYPEFAAVAMSFAPQSTGADPSRGFMIIGAGLGERLVTKGGRFAMLEKPAEDYDKGQERPQDTMVVMDMQAQAERMMNIDDLRAEGGLSQIVESCGSNDGRTGSAITCKYLLRENIPLFIEYVVKKLEFLLGYRVDCEFTIRKCEERKWKVNLVQCRPQNIPANLRPSRMPENVPDERVLISGEKSINATNCEGVTHFLYIDPALINEVTDERARADLRQYISTVNGRFKDGKDNGNKYLVINPGRWGSEETRAGIHVTFGDFCHASGALEVHDNENDNGSCGTHFFNDFMDAGMVTGTFVHQEEGGRQDLNMDFFRGAAHSANFPEPPAGLQKYVKVIDVNAQWEKKYGKAKRGKGWVINVAQDNLSKDEKPSRVYVAEKGKDLPVAVDKNGIVEEK